MGLEVEFQAPGWPTAETPPKDDDPGNSSVDFHDEQRRNILTDRQPTPTRGWPHGTDKKARLSYAGHVLMKNRNGLAVNCCVTQASYN